MSDIADEPFIINRVIVAPSPNGPKRLGVARRTIVDHYCVTQIYFLENDNGLFGDLVTRRCITRSGHTQDDIYDPPVKLSELTPPMPLVVDGGVGAKGRRATTRLSNAARLARQRQKLARRRKVAND